MSDIQLKNDTASVEKESPPPEKLSPKGMSAMQGNVEAAAPPKAEPPAPETEAKTPVDYSRPGGFRQGVRDQVWEDAKNSKGEVIDPLTKKTIDPSEDWHMGHKPGYEFHKLQDDAAKAGISRKEFLDIHNDPSHYRPELPKSNCCHKGEAGPSVDKWRL